MTIGSSLSSGSIGSSSSESVSDDSEPSMFMLPSELDTTLLSVWCMPGQRVWSLLCGESRAKEVRLLRRWGIIMPFWVIVGEESGEDCSARVE